MSNDTTCSFVSKKHLPKKEFGTELGRWRTNRLCFHLPEENNPHGRIPQIHGAWSHGEGITCFRLDFYAHIVGTSAI